MSFPSNKQAAVTLKCLIPLRRHLCALILALCYECILVSTENIAPTIHCTTIYLPSINLNEVIVKDGRGTLGDFIKVVLLPQRNRET